jgi:hypothetical protein
LIGLPLAAGDAGATPPRAGAARVKAAPTIDGRLRERAWKRAAVVRDFVQRAPHEGRPPWQRTELRLLYDASSLYVGLRMWDRRPELIRRGLGRRDGIPDSDKVTVFIDPVLSRQRGYWFRINASGVMADGLVINEVVIDNSWDGVWEGAARVDARGWTAELRIPLTSIAFQDLRRQDWGLYVERYVQRTKEQSGWPAMPKSSNTFVSRFGTLAGLEGLRRASSLRLLPYVAVDLSLNRPADSLYPDTTARPNAGLDLRYSFTGGTSLSATFNPDFGQVEEDPAVVNLTPNEVFWPEQRPFFVEGSSLFQTPIQLLHTRRIGARPGAPEASEGGTIVELDPEARIAGAAKLIGDLGPASYGLLSSFVLPSHAREQLADGSVVQRDALPAAGHYGAARMLVRPTARANLGLMFTALTHYSGADEIHDAYAGGLDWDLRSGSGWQTRGQLTGAVQEKPGYGLWLMAGQKGAPRWRYWLELESFSADYEINDVGYQWRADMVQIRAYVMRRLPAPWRSLRELELLLWGQYGFNHDAPELGFERRVELALWTMFTSGWHIWPGVGYVFPTEDDRETRGGPPFQRPAVAYFWVGGQSDSSRRLWADHTTSVSFEDGAPWLHTRSWIHGALFDRLTLSLYLSYRFQRGRPRWVETLDWTGRDRHIFGDLDLDEFELRLSGVLGLTRELTLQLFGQLLHSVGRYGDSYRELLPLADGATALGPTDYDADADFSRLTLLFNAVLRWDLGSGAAAYLVYKLAGDLDRDGRPVAFDLGQALSELSLDHQSHLLLFKVSYGWNL